jgi:hypothetical protein
MMPRASRLACLLLVLAVTTDGIAAPSPEASPVIRYKFKVGDKLRYTVVQKVETTLNINGMEESQKTNHIVDVTWQIVSVDKEGNGRIKQQINRIRYTTDSPGHKEEIDTRGEKGGDGGLGKRVMPVFKAAVSERFEVTMTPTGAIKGLKVPEGFVKAVKEHPGMGGIISEDGLKTIVNQSGFLLPKQAPVKGKTWQDKKEVKMPRGKMITTVAQSYQGQVKRDGKTLEAFRLAPVSKFEANSETPTKITRQESKGTVYFDKAAGRLVETVLTSSLEMELGTGNDAVVYKTQRTATMKLNDGK